MDVMTRLLEVEQLEVRFGDKAVVRGVSFAIAAGEKLALVGESGSGKTITALSLLRLVPDARITGQGRINDVVLRKHVAIGRLQKLYHRHLVEIKRQASRGGLGLNRTVNCTGRPMACNTSL